MDTEPMTTNSPENSAEVGIDVQRLVRHSVEWTVENMIATYPSLFYSRTQALHHLFVVLGCGYRWKDGKLIDEHSEPVRDRIPRKAAQILAQNRIDLEHPYPWSDLCNLAELPDDADEDWKAAAKEAQDSLPNAHVQGAAPTSDDKNGS